MKKKYTEKYKDNVWIGVSEETRDRLKFKALRNKLSMRKLLEKLSKEPQ